MMFSEEEEWKKGELIGSGGFASVYKATTNPKQTYMSPVIAVKTAMISKSSILTKEENGQAYFNMLLEYASLGTLGDRIRQYLAGVHLGLPEPEV
ncbi:hypothetical protein IFM89_006491 [Coptis chinensis]|uniref:Protein kinase domain-containing protein n=1 Tax=Coptis chinensis TaxID=261450 RepID=A0A835ILB6_9MAGN|nr:hypothetical protein IFM89_006491 [Coptis chinensis]